MNLQTQEDGVKYQHVLREVKRMTREEAINAIKCNYPPENYSMLREALDMAIEALEEVKEGYWYSYDPERCSVCKLPWNYNMTMNGDDCEYFDPMPNFCPNCGAKMRSDEE